MYHATYTNALCMILVFSPRHCSVQRYRAQKARTFLADSYPDTPITIIGLKVGGSEARAGWEGSRLQLKATRKLPTYAQYYHTAERGGGTE